MELIQRTNDEHTQTSGEQGESLNNAGSKDVSGSKGSNPSALQFSGANSTTTIHKDEFDSSVAMLNTVGSFFSLY